MGTSPLPIRRIFLGAALLATIALVGGAKSEADQNTGAEVKPVAMEKLPNVPGKSLTAVVVTYAPGEDRASITMPAACLPMFCLARSDRRTRPPDPAKSTRRARASSSRPVASIWSARTQARLSRRACWPSSLPMTAQT